MFHRIWLTDPLNPKPIPSKYEDNWNAWRRQFPDEVFRTWTNGDIEDFPSVSSLVHEAQGMARKADIFRYAILYEFGGVYLDCDVEPYHRPAFLQNVQQLIVCSESDDETICSIGFIAAPRQAPVFADIINELHGKPLNALPPNEETGPLLFGAHVNRQQGVKKLPTNAFYPYDLSEARAAILDRNLGGTYGIHQWGASWLSETHHTQLLEWKSLQSESLEIEQAICEGKIDPTSKVVQISRGLRKLRQECIAFATLNEAHLGELIIEPQTHFEFLKFAYWLIENKKEIIIWQVGAADGVLVDPLRPLMIRFNPIAVLLEPNPFIFNELKKNYAKNDRAVLLNAALTEADCQLEMNCIDPDQVKAQELPEWVLGVSSFHDDKNVLDGRDISPQLHERILKSVRRTSVKGLDVKSVIAESGVGLPDVLVVDAEGADAQVIRLILSEGRQPMIVHFEHCNLSEAETKQVNQLLTPDYVLLKFGNDTTAYKADIFKEYCVFLAVEHGILNIFGSLLGKVKLFHTSKSLFSPAQEGHGAAVPSSPSEKTLDENNFITLSLLHSTIHKTTRKGLASRLQRLGDSLRKRLSTRPRKKDFPLEKRLQRHARYSRRLTNILGAYALVATIALCLR